MKTPAEIRAYADRRASEIGDPSAAPLIYKEAVLAEAARVEDLLAEAARLRAEEAPDGEA